MVNAPDGHLDTCSTSSLVVAFCIFTQGLSLGL